jgi:hypothetical protein
MPEASSSVDPATGTSPTAETRADIWQLSPEEATAILEQRAADFHAPAPLVPSNAREAAERLAQLSADPAWAKRYMEGNLEARDEFKALTEMVANAPDVDPVSQPFQTTIGQDVKRSDVLSAAADLRALWRDSDNCEAAIAEILNPDVQLDPGFVQDMRDWKADLLSDPLFVQALFNGDRLATARLKICDAAIALGTEGL